MYVDAIARRPPTGEPGGPWSLPQPATAPIAFPGCKASASELQVKPVVAGKKSATAGVTYCEEDLGARRAADVDQRLAQSARGIQRVHAEGERRIVQQCRGERRGGRARLRVR